MKNNQIIYHLSGTIKVSEINNEIANQLINEFVRLRTENKKQIEQDIKHHFSLPVEVQMANNPEHIKKLFNAYKNKK